MMFFCLHNTLSNIDRHFKTNECVHQYWGSDTDAFESVGVDHCCAFRRKVEPWFPDIRSFSRINFVPYVNYNKINIHILKTFKGFINASQQYYILKTLKGLTNSFLEYYIFKSIRGFRSSSPQCYFLKYIGGITSSSPQHYILKYIGTLTNSRIQMKLKFYFIGGGNSQKS